jgi:hypothetical protein
MGQVKSTIGGYAELVRLSSVILSPSLSINIKKRKIAKRTKKLIFSVFPSQFLKKSSPILRCLRLKLAV